VTVEDEPTDASGVKSSLRRLAGPDDEQVIERATEAVEGIEAAATFVERVDLSELETAVARADDPELESRGQRALDEFLRFRRAATGEKTGGHFHSGRGTPIRTDPEGSNR